MMTLPYFTTKSFKGHLSLTLMQVKLVILSIEVTGTVILMSVINGSMEAPFI